jgi:hypothetical protein
MDHNQREKFNIGELLKKKLRPQHLHVEDRRPHTPPAQGGYRVAFITEMEEPVKKGNHR